MNCPPDLDHAPLPGSHLHDNWLIILRCLSRYSLMSQVATGAIMDNSLFQSIDPQQKHEVRKSWWMSTRRATEKTERDLHPLQPGSLMDAGMDIGLGSDARARIPTPGTPTPALLPDVLSDPFVISRCCIPCVLLSLCIRIVVSGD